MTPSAMSTPLHNLPLGHTLRYSVYTVPKSSQAVQEPGSTHPVSSPVTLQERKQQFVRDAIWDAAIDLFDRKGFDETTVEEIAQAAGTSRRSFFRYFESKSDLLAQAVVSYGTSLTDAIENCPAKYSLGDVFRSTVLLGRAAPHAQGDGDRRTISGGAGSANCTSSRGAGPCRQSLC
jgi:hypothetical protein